MTPHVLSAQESALLEAAEFTYPSVGCTRERVVPTGFGGFSRSVNIGTGSARFAEAAGTLFGWQMHRKARIRVRASSELVTAGAVAVLQLGVGSLSLRAPVRVAYVIDEPGRVGFAYGTLPGHPESGEEAFILEIDSDGQISFTIRAVSEPASALARCAGPAGRGLQQWITRRYLRAL